MDLRFLAWVQPQQWMYKARFLQQAELYHLLYKILNQPHLQGSHQSRGVVGPTPQNVYSYIFVKYKNDKLYVQRESLANHIMSCQVKISKLALIIVSYWLIYLFSKLPFTKYLKSQFAKLSPCQIFPLYSLLYSLWLQGEPAITSSYPKSTILYRYWYIHFKKFIG